MIVECWIRPRQCGPIAPGFMHVFYQVSADLSMQAGEGDKKSGVRPD